MTTKTKTDSNAPLACLGLLVLVPIVIAVFSILNGLIGAMLWNWFLVPVADVKPISIPLAIGISMLVRLWGNSSDKIKEEYKENGPMTYVMPLVSYAVTYGMACILHHFFM